MSNKRKVGYTTPNEQRESVHSTCPRERTTSALVLLYASLDGGPVYKSVCDNCNLCCFDII